MRRREFITLLGGARQAWPLAARAQQVGKVYRIGILEPIPAAQNAANLDALRKGLRDLGYVEGRNSGHRISVGGWSRRAVPGPRVRTGSSQGRPDRDQGDPCRPGGQKRDRNNSGGYGDDGRPACHRRELRAARRAILRG